MGFVPENKNYSYQEVLDIVNMYKKKVQASQAATHKLKVRKGASSKMFKRKINDLRSEISSLKKKNALDVKMLQKQRQRANDWMVKCMNMKKLRTRLKTVTIEKPESTIAPNRLCRILYKTNAVRLKTKLTFIQITCMLWLYSKGDEGAFAGRFKKDIRVKTNTQIYKHMIRLGELGLVAFEKQDGKGRKRYYLTHKGILYAKSIDEYIRFSKKKNG